MKKLSTILFASMVALSSAAFAESNVKLCSFTLGEDAIGKTASWNISGTDGQNIQVDWGNGTKSEAIQVKNYDTDWEYGTFSGTIAGTTITVYGENAATINILDLGYAAANDASTKILSVDVTPLTNVTELNLATNLIQTIDLSNNKELAKLLAPNNSLTDMTVAADNKIVRIDFSNGQNIGENAMLGYDFSKLPNLNYLSLNYNNKSGDVTTFDISKNAEIGSLYLLNNNLSSVNIAGLTKITYISCNNNNLTEFDASGISGNRTSIFLMNNQLTKLVPPTTAVRAININGNKFTFATLPPLSSCTTLTYATQQAMEVKPAGLTVDLSSQAKIGDKNTVYTWTAGGEAVESSAYTAEGGVFTFAAPAEDLVCSMTNEAYPRLTLKTAPISVNDKTKLFSFTVDDAAVGMNKQFGVSATDGQMVSVDWGDGKISDPVKASNYDDTWEYTVLSGKLAGNTVTVYGENAETINTIDVGYDKENDAATKLTALDVTPLTAVVDINMPSNNVAKLDLTSNASLKTLGAASNALTEILLPENCKLETVELQNTADAGDNAMLDIDLAKLPALKSIRLNFNNKAQKEGLKLNFPDNANLKNIYVLNNDLEEMTVGEMASAAYVSFNNNKLTKFDASKLKGNATVFAMNNNLEEFVAPAAKIKTINVTGNKLNFATLPSPTAANNIVCASQQPMEITAMSNVVDLSSQAKVGDNVTTFAWTSNDEAFDKYTAENGVFTFTANADNLVCTMTNASYPNLKLTTTPVSIATSAVNEIETDGDAHVEYYNLQGIKVNGTQPGLYIRRQGAKAQTVIIK